MQTRLSVVQFLLFLMISCSPQSEKNSQESNAADAPAKGVTVEPFGKLGDDTPISLYTMRNSKGVVMKVMNYGGIIVSLEVPDRDGNLVDVLLGYDSLEAYEKRNPFFGSLVGRYGNRIAKGKFVLDGYEINASIHDSIRAEALWKARKYRTGKL